MGQFINLFQEEFGSLPDNKNFKDYIDKLPKYEDCEKIVHRERGDYDYIDICEKSKLYRLITK